MGRVPDSTPLEVEPQDENLVISKQADGFANAQGASVAPEEKSQVLSNSDGVLDADRVETVLQVTFPKMRD